MTTQASEVLQERKGVHSLLRQLLALGMGILALIVAWLRTGERSHIEGAATTSAVLVLGTVLVVLVVSWLRRRHFDIYALALGLASASLVLAGIPELPSWVSIDSLGSSVFTFPILLVVMALSLHCAVGRKGVSLDDGSVLLFVVFASAGGALFVQRTESFYPLLTALAAIGLLAVGGKPRPSLREVPLLPSFLCFLALLVLPWITAIDTDRHLSGILRVALAGFPLVVMGLSRAGLAQAFSVVRVLLVMVTLGAVISLLSLVEASAHIDFSQLLAARLSALGLHPNLIAPWFAASIPLFLAMGLGGSGKGNRLLAWVGFLLVLACLLLTRSRASIAAGLAGAGVFVGILMVFRVYRWRPRRSTTVMLALLSLVLAAAMTVALSDKVASRLSDSSLSFRVYMWEVAGEAITDRPWLGYGLLTGEPLAANAPSSNLDGSTKNIHPHSLPLFIALGAGLPALLGFFWLIGTFFWKTVSAAGRFEEGRTRLLAVATLSSAGALLLTNLVDQGLSNTVPFPLHLGVLLGIASVLCRKNTTTVSLREGRVGQLLLFAPFLFLGVISLATEGLMSYTQIQMNERNVAGANRSSEVARQINPFSLRTGIVRARVLGAMGRSQAALRELEGLTEKHPLSAVPWEAICSIELESGRLLNAYRSIQKALALDATGPMSFKWLLRAGLIQRRLGHPKLAIDLIARAMRFNAGVAKSMDWRETTEGDYILHTNVEVDPVHLRDVLMHNRKLLPKLYRQDPTMGHRAAAALAWSYVDYGFYEEAISVIDEQAILSGVSFVPLQFLKIMISQNLNPDDEALRESDVERMERTGEFRGAGDAALLLAEGRKMVELGDLDGAQARFIVGIAAMNDVSAERENAGWLLEELFWLCLRQNDLKEAARWLVPTLYFQHSAPGRLERSGQMVDALLSEKKYPEAITVLTEVVGCVPWLKPDTDQNSVKQLSRRLASLLKAEGNRNHRQQMDDLMADLMRSEAGMSAIVLAYQKSGNLAEAKRLKNELRHRYPGALSDRP